MIKLYKNTKSNIGSGYAAWFLAALALTLAIKADAFDAVLLWMAIVCCVSTINKF